MLNKLFSFLGFNLNESLVGLSQLTDNDIKPTQTKRRDTSKTPKLSELMRGE